MNFDNAPLVSIGTGSSSLVGYGDWPRGTVNGYLYIVDKHGKIEMVAVYLKHGYTILDSIEKIEDCRLKIQRQVLNVTEEIGQVQDYLKLVNLSDAFLKKLDFNLVQGKKSPEKFAVLKYYTNQYNTLFGLYDRDKRLLKIAHDYQPYDRYRAATNKDLSYTEVHLSGDHGWSYEKIIYVIGRKSKKEASIFMATELKDTLESLQSKKDQISLFEGMFLMLDKKRRIILGTP